MWVGWLVGSFVRSFRCYGRFETPDYTLKDLDGKWYPGHSFKNPQLELPGGDPKSHINEPFLTPVQMNRQRHWRMPWNDVHSCVTGQAAADVAMMLVQRWQVCWCVCVCLSVLECVCA